MKHLTFYVDKVDDQVDSDHVRTLMNERSQRDWELIQITSHYFTW